MKVAVSAFENNVESEVNPVFGRCPVFLVIEEEGGVIKGHSALENPAAGAGSGAGIAAAQAVVEAGVEAVVTGNVGPNAFIVLQQSGVKVFRATGKISNAIKMLDNGKLDGMKSFNVESHFGMGRGFGRGGAGMGPGRGMGRGAGRGRRAQM